MMFAGVYIERTKIHATIEKQLDEGSDKTPRTRTIAMESFDVPSGNQRESLSILQKVAELIAAIRKDDEGKDDDVRAVGIGSYGPFLNLGNIPYFRGETGYGCLTKDADFPFSGVDLPQVFMAPFRARGGMAPRISVQTDANAMALGEAWRRGLRENDLLISVILTEGVGGGIVAGRMRHRRLHPGLFGALHPEMGLIQISRHPCDPIKDDIQKSPDYHSNVGSLVCAPAMLQRARKLRIKARTLGDILSSNHEKLWPVAAYYIAQLCLACTVLLTPTKIVIGGPMVERPTLIQEINDEFEKFKAGRNGLPMPDYHDMRDPSFICGPSEGHLFSGLAGCVYLAIMADRVFGQPTTVVQI